MKGYLCGLWRGEKEENHHDENHGIRMIANNFIYDYNANRCHMEVFCGILCRCKSNCYL